MSCPILSSEEGRGGRGRGAPAEGRVVHGEVEGVEADVACNAGTPSGQNPQENRQWGNPGETVRENPGETVVGKTPGKPSLGKPFSPLRKTLKPTGKNFSGTCRGAAGKPPVKTPRKNRRLRISGITVSGDTRRGGWTLGGARLLFRGLEALF